jgi:hypothetical protein
MPRIILVCCLIVSLLLAGCASRRGVTQARASGETQEADASGDAPWIHSPEAPIRGNSFWSKLTEYTCVVCFALAAGAVLGGLLFLWISSGSPSLDFSSDDS